MSPKDYCHRCRGEHPEHNCRDFQAARESQRRESAIKHHCHLCR